MNRKYGVAAVLASSILWTGCVLGQLGGSHSRCSTDCDGPLTGPEPGLRLSVSAQALEDRKTASENSYAYTVDNSSWTGSRYRTEMTVKGGQVVKREFAGWETDDSGKQVLVSTYIETDSIGTHVEGFRPKTLDSLYADCRGHIQGDQSRGRVILEFDRDNILKACGYVVNGCQDDCRAEIQLDTLIWGP